MNKWYHDKRAGLVKAEGQEGYICRGFRAEHGDLLAAAPDLLKACQKALHFIENGRRFGYIQMPDEDIGDTALLTPGIICNALAKAEGRKTTL